MTFAHLLSRCALHRSALILVIALAGFIESGDARAAKVSAVCSGGGQLCNNIPTFLIPTFLIGVSGGVLMAKFHPGPLTCSRFRVHLLVDGTEVAVTGFVGPKQSTGFFTLGFIGPGTHTVGVQAEGEVGGCNIGTLLSWAGKVKLKKGP